MCSKQLSILYNFSKFGILFVCALSLSHVQLFATPWSVAHQAPLSMGFPRQEYWSRLPFPSPGNLPSTRIELRSPALQADSLLSEPPAKPSYIRAKVILFGSYTLNQFCNNHWYRIYPLSGTGVTQKGRWTYGVYKLEYFNKNIMQPFGGENT